MAAIAPSPPATRSPRRSSSSFQADPEEHVPFFQVTGDTMASSQTLGSLFNAVTKNDQHQPMLPDANSPLTVLSIVGGCIFAVILAAGYHFFLFYLHRQNVEYFSQSWVKNLSNALSNVFSISLSLSVTCALIQIKWRVATSEALQIRTIDNLFALPSPLAVLGSVIRLDPSLLLPIGASIFIHALVFVNILAPNALTIRLSERVPRDIQVPTLNLGLTQEMVTIFLPPNPNPNSTNATAVISSLKVVPEWEFRLKAILLHPPEVNWKAPQGCESACHFELEYDAPALQCRDTIPDEYRLYPDPFDPFDASAYGMGRPLYEGNTTMSPNMTTTEFDAQYYLNINYAQIYRGPRAVAGDPNPRGHQGGLSVVPGGGTYCRLRNATYKAIFDVSNNTQRINTTVKSYGAVLSLGDCGVWGSGIPYHCRYWWPSTWALFSVFTTAFMGIAQTESMVWNFPDTPLFVQSLFIHNQEGGPPGAPYISLAAPNLTETIAGLFANMTLGLIPYRNDVTWVKATVLTGISVWEYTYWKLWAVYGPALMFGLPVMVYGLYCIHSTKAGKDDKFSNFLLSTRGGDLDEACKRAVDFEHLQRVRLVHQTRGLFTVEPEDIQEGDNPREVEGKGLDNGS